MVGLEVREGYRFPKKDSGKVKFIAARKGVVLCYGSLYMIGEIEAGLQQL